MDQNYILDAALAGRLEKYRLVRHRPVPEGYSGSRPSTQKGGAVEFSDYRDYTAGDELRRVDWKAYARLGRLYVKEYQDERRNPVLFLMDTSASMDWGNGGEHKGRYALGLVAGLSLCALAGGDGVAVVAGAKPGTPQALDTTDDEILAYPSNPPVRVFPTRDGRQALPLLWNWLGETHWGGGTDLVGCLRAGLSAMPGAASLYAVSDLLAPAGVEEMLRLAASRGLATTLLQVLAPDELEPPGDGEWTMVDMETGSWVEVSLTPTALRDYDKRLRDFYATMDQSCRHWGARRVLVSTGPSLEETFLRTLPGQGVLRVTAMRQVHPGRWGSGF